MGSVLLLRTFLGGKPTSPRLHHYMIVNSKILHLSKLFGQTVCAVEQDCTTHSSNFCFV